MKLSSVAAITSYLSTARTMGQYGAAKRAASRLSVPDQFAVVDAFIDAHARLKPAGSHR